VSYTSRISTLSLIALLVGGSAISQAGFAHSEGIEAADPSTPAALLVFEGAVFRYSKPNSKRLQWRELFDDRADSAHQPHRPLGATERSDQYDTATADSATMHQ
jgi:hypothetical protein